MDLALERDQLFVYFTGNLDLLPAHSSSYRVMQGRDIKSFPRKTSRYAAKSVSGLHEAAKNRIAHD
jgi:hypothetical protein